MNKRKAFFFIASVFLMLIMLAAGVFAQVSQRDNIYRYLSIFTEVFRLVRDNYVEDVPSQKLVSGAFAGVTDAIDEFSYYVTPAQMADYRKYNDDEGSGIGIIVSRRFGYAYVVAPRAGSAAKSSGIQAGDFIEKINGAPTQQMAIWQMRRALQDAAGKPLELTVLRGGMSKRDEFKLSLDKNVPPSAPKLEMIGQVGLIRIPYFSPGTSAKFAEALHAATKAGVKRLVVDVRGNAGGSFDEAIASVDQLLSKGTITTLSGRRVEKKSWNADPEEAYTGELLVLTDNSAASGAEVFAAAITGNQRGKSVGIPTYGKAIVQKFVALPSGGGLYLTIAHYTTPEGKPIKEIGVRPDVMVDLSPLALRDPGSTEPPEDLILEKALSMFGENVHRTAA
jgi:carboxyl-terminal processing protease